MKFFILVSIVTLTASRYLENESKYLAVEHELTVVTEPNDFGFKEKILIEDGQIAYEGSAVEGQFPWVTRLALFAANNHYLQCSGSLISANFILSARHSTAM